MKTTFLSPDRIQLGFLVQDLTSGFEGIVTSRAEFYNGSIRFGVQPSAQGGNDELPPDHCADCTRPTRK